MLKSMDGPVYRGLVPPGVDLLGHANRLGINLRSGHLLGQNMGVSGHYYGSLSSQYHTTAEGYGSPAYHLGTFNRPMMKKNRHSQSPRIDVATTAALISHQRAAHQGSPEGHLGSAQGRLGSAQGRLGSAHIRLGSAQPGSRRSGRPSATPTYIRNVVVPLQTYNESVTVEQSYPATQPTVKAYHSVRAKSAEARPDTESYFPARPPNSRVQSAYSDRSGHRRPQSSTPLEQNHGNSNHGNQGSSQSLRFEMERERQDQSRVRKRSSQVSGHRVDQQYYMTGNNFRLRARYQVEDEELRRLKELSSARTQAAHYGRGLSKYKYYGLPIHEHFMAPTDLNLRECSTGRPMESDKSFGVITVVPELPSGQEAAENETSVAPYANQTEISAKEKSSEKDRMSPDRIELLDTYQLTDQNATPDPSIDQKASTRPTGILAEAAALRSPKLLRNLSRTLHQLPLTRSVEPRGQRCVSPGGLTPAVWGPGGNSPGRSSPGVHSYIPPRSPDVTHGLRLVPNHDEGSNNHDLPWRSASPQIERWPPMLTVMDLDHSGLDSTTEKSAHNGDNYNPDHLQNQKSAQSAESQQDNKHKGAELNGSHDDDTPSGAEPNREATPTEVEHNGEVRDNPSDENSEHLNDADGQQNADEENTSQVDDVNQPMNDLNLDDPAEAADDVSETAADDAVDNTENDVTPTTAAEGDDSGHDEPADNVQNTDDA